MPGIEARPRLPFPINPLAARPRVAAREAAETAALLWGIRGRAEPLSGERDANFLIEDDEGERFVLKVGAAAESVVRFALQDELVRHARERDPGLPLPAAIPTPAGDQAVTRRFGPDECPVRLFPYFDGVPLSTFRRRPAALLASVGRLVGRLQRALAGFDHPGLEVQEIPWAPGQASNVIEAASQVLGEGETGRLYRRVAAWVGAELSALMTLPSAALQNDANDDNLLLLRGDPEGAEPERLALLDFGDAVRGPAISEAATAALYAALTAYAPLPAAARVLAGFARERPVTAVEAESFRTAIATRALVSAGVAALRRAYAPEAATEAYLMVSEVGMWRFLQALDDESPALTTGRFRSAGGHPPLPRLAARQAAARRAAAAALPPIALAADTRILDLSPTSPALDPEAAPETLREMATTATTGERFAVGRYGEPRVSGLAVGKAAAAENGEPATIPLGIEVFGAAGTPVRAPLDGVVVWATVEAEASGSVALGLRHEAQGEGFWTAYRGLDPECLPRLAPGCTVRRGAALGVLADRPAGGWPPHLQFQVALVDRGSPPPRGSAVADLPVLAALSPDPTGFFDLQVADRPSREASEGRGARLLERRARRISRALSVSYDDPVRVVRGRGARLYDDAGRDFLDLVNNVCHVGHSHPRVVEAIARQASLLNTNTRYLYSQLTDYADRLVETLPRPLEVVFLTNSGSEANDLALRIARAHLGRPDTLVFEGGYHGNLTSLIEVSPYKLDGAGGRPGPPWLSRLPMPDGFRGAFRAESPDFPGSLIADAESRIRRLGPATLIGEAILSCGGQIVPPPGYLRALYRAVRSVGGVIVADEVQTGFGRTGPDFWAFLAVQGDGERVVPDIVTLGKPAGNGHPLGAVVTTRELARSFETGMEYFNTFGGNPVSCAAGLAVLDVIEEERRAEHAQAVGGQLLDGLQRLRTRYPILGQVRGRGLFLGFEMVRDPESREPAAREARRLVNRLREFRILNSTDGPDANVIKLKPPLPFSPSDAAHYLEVLETVLEEQF